MPPKTQQMFMLVTSILLAACAPQPALTHQPSEPTSEPSPTAPPSATSTPPSELSGKFEVNGHSLFVTCLGSGSPTIVLEAGEGGSAQGFEAIQRTLAERTTTCAYDRANNGRSERGVPTPRTAKDVVEDLHALLAVANVSGPYLLVGHSAGGMFVQLFAQTYPDEIAGVVSMNPVPPAHPWLDEVSKTFTNEEYAAELAYYQGDNKEGIDYIGSSEQITLAPIPTDIPFEMLFSTSVDCGFDEVCAKASSIAPQITQSLTTAWPGGSFVRVAADHNIYIDDPDAVVAAVERILSKL